MNTTGKFQPITPFNTGFQRVLALDSEQFPRPWSKKNWDELNWEHHLLFSWSTAESLSAFSLFSRIPGDNSAHLLKVCVTESLRGSGVIQLFWESCIEYLKKNNLLSIYLEVETTNQRAIAFYQKSGFKTLRNIKSYYSDGADAMTMQMII